MPIQIPNFALAADFVNVTIQEVGGVAPSTIIEAGRDWTVNIQWSLAGTGFEMIGGMWHVHVNLESFGPGPELSLADFIPPETSDVPLPSADGQYALNFTVPGRVLDSRKVPHQGLAMKMVVLLTYRNLLGHIDDMAGYYEGPMLQFYRSDAD